jgi:hypothetical protein
MRTLGCTEFINGYSTVKSHVTLTLVLLGKTGLQHCLAKINKRNQQVTYTILCTIRKYKKKYKPMKN